MSNLDDILGRGSIVDNEEYEFYEDTHNEMGEYTRRLHEFTKSSLNVDREESFSPRTNPIVAKTVEKKDEKGVKTLRNVMVYEPNVIEDAQNIIDYIKSREPIILNLEKTEVEVSQRILDFCSGAVYALEGTIHPVSGEVFLIVPEKVKVLLSDEGKK